MSGTKTLVPRDAEKHLNLRLNYRKKSCDGQSDKKTRGWSWKLKQRAWKMEWTVNGKQSKMATSKGTGQLCFSDVHFSVDIFSVANAQNSYFFAYNTKNYPIVSYSKLPVTFQCLTKRPAISVGFRRKAVFNGRLETLFCLLIQRCYIGFLDFRMVTYSERQPAIPILVDESDFLFYRTTYPFLRQTVSKPDPHRTPRLL